MRGGALRDPLRHGCRVQASRRGTRPLLLVERRRFARRRQLLVFDRFLARIALEFGDSVTLKGGIVVELRVERARTTRDIDVRLVGPPTLALDRLKRAASLELGDFMIFVVVPDAEHPEITNEGMVYEGQRYRVTCSLAGKPYGQPL